MRHWIGVLLTLLLAAAGATEAHGSRTATIDVLEVAPGRAAIHVRTVIPDDRVTVSLDAPCTAQPLDGSVAPGVVTRSLQVECPGTIAGRSLAVSGLGPIVAEAVIIYSFADGRSGSSVVRADAPVFRLPVVASRIDVARSYVSSGIAHILSGYDHLLFLLLLVLNLRRVRAVLLAETAFTLSHSISFSATALGLIHVSPLAAEACIALSLVLMALDIRIGEPGPALRGASLAFVFGLVHGLGFAGALSEVGLPDRDVAVALLGFAGGVEAGQVLFLCVALMTLHALLRGSEVVFSRLEPVAVALLGGVSTFWLIERVLVIVAARV